MTSFFFCYLLEIMAPTKSKTRANTVVLRLEKKRVRNKGIHAKTKMSKNKGSKNYVKVSRGQG